MESQFITPLTYRAFLNGVALITPWLVMVSRVYLQYHTFEQVIAGYVFGLIFGYIWWRVSKLSEKPITNLVQQFFLTISYFDDYKLIRWLALENKTNKD